MASPDAHCETESGDRLSTPAQLAPNREASIVFSKDGIHPYLDTGHALYTMTISRAMESIGGWGNAERISLLRR